MLFKNNTSNTPCLLQIPSFFIFPPDSPIDWNYKSENDGYIAQGHKDNVISLIRGKMLGGTSSCNVMVYARGSPADYNSWASIVGDETWNWDGVLPYMIKSERLESIDLIDSTTSSQHGTKGLLGVTKFVRPEADTCLNALGELYDVVLDVNGNHTFGATHTMFTIADNQRQSTARAFLTPIKDCKNLHVLKNTLVTKILFDDDNNAVGVEALSENGKKLTLKAGKEVILSAGAFNTPQLLMLSGIGPKEHLKSFDIDVIADLPVGQDLRDHASILISHKLPKSIELNPLPTLTEFPFPLLMALAALNKSQSFPDYETLSLMTPRDTIFNLIFCTHVLTFRDDICNALYEASKGSELMMTLVSFLHPESNGQVLLRSKDPRDPPKVYLGCFSNDNDLKNGAKFMKDFARIVNTTNFKSVDAEFVDLNLPECKSFEMGSTEYWECYILIMMTSEWHFCSTAAMGTVLTPRLQVKGVNRLRVADASAMPLITSGNINVPVIMIAEKAADMIKEDYKATVDGCDSSKQSSSGPSKKNNFILAGASTYDALKKNFVDPIKPSLQPNFTKIAYEYYSKMTEIRSKYLP